MEKIWEATLLIKAEPAATREGLDQQLDTASKIMQQIERLLESIYSPGGQYHREGFIVEFEEC